MAAMWFITARRGQRKGVVIMASSSDSVVFEWHGMDNFIGDLDEMEQSFQSFVSTGMERYSLLVESGARALAFRFGGDLEQSIIAANIAVRNGMVIGNVGTNLVYAWRLHEKPYGNKIGDLHDNGIKIRGYYIGGRGRRTREKAKFRGQVPGRKFLERAVDATEEEFYILMNEAYARALQRWGG